MEEDTDLCVVLKGGWIGLGVQQKSQEGLVWSAAKSFSWVAGGSRKATRALWERIVGWIR